MIRFFMTMFLPGSDCLVIGSANHVDVDLGTFPPVFVHDPPAEEVVHAMGWRYRWAEQKLEVRFQSFQSRLDLLGLLVLLHFLLEIGHVLLALGSLGVCLGVLVNIRKVTQPARTAARFLELAVHFIKDKHRGGKGEHDTMQMQCGHRQAQTNSCPREYDACRDGLVDAEIPHHVVVAVIQSMRDLVVTVLHLVCSS